MVVMSTDSRFSWMRNDGWMLVVTATNTSSTAMMPNSRTRNTRSVSLREPPPAGGPAGSRRSVTVVVMRPASRARSWSWRLRPQSRRLLLQLAGGGGHDLLFRGLRVPELRGQPPLAHDQDPVADVQHLGQFRRDHQDGDPVPGQPDQQPVH